MDEKQLRTLQSFDEIAESARYLIQTQDANFPKFVRTFNRKEAYVYLKCDGRTLDRYIKELGIDPKKYEGLDFLITLDEIYKIRDALPATTILKSTIQKFTRRKGQRCQRIVIQNQKGGVGKTVTADTAATGLAIEYHQEYRVCLVDMDGQSTLSMYHPPMGNTYRRTTIGDLMRAELMQPMDNEQFEKMVRSAVADTTIPNLKILPADQKDRQLEADFHKAVFSGKLENPYSRLSRILDIIEDDFDIIIIDTPPSYGFASLNSYRAATSVIFPLSATQNDLDATCNYFSYLPEVYSSLIESGHKGYDFIRIILTNYEESSSTLDVQSSLTDKFSKFMLGEVFKKSEAVRKCALEKNSVFDVSASTYNGPKNTLLAAVINAKSVVAAIHRDIYNIWQQQLEVE
ncbi:AAA family ATPase [Vibrio metoecus]|nr:ParA family protein [Vibrio cholerae]